MNNTAKISSVAFGTAVVLIYSLLFIILTFPLILHFNEAFVGSCSGYRDLPWEIWLHWIVGSSVRAGESFFYTNLAHFPIGISVLIDTGYFFIPLLAVLPSFFFNQAAGFNITVFALTVFSAFAGYLLVRYLVRDRAAGILGGFVFGFSPYVFNEFIYGRLPEVFGTSKGMLNLRGDIDRLDVSYNAITVGFPFDNHVVLGVTKRLSLVVLILAAIAVSSQVYRPAPYHPGHRVGDESMVGKEHLPVTPDESGRARILSPAPRGKG